MLKAPFPALEDFGWDTLGLMHWPCNGWGGPNPNLVGTASWTVNDSNYIKNFAALVEMIKLLSAHKIHLLAINFPESPYYKSTDHYQGDGPSWETGRAVLAQVKDLENSYPFFHVYDAYDDSNHDYTDEDAANWNHLCPNGAKKLSIRLDSLIQTILP
jgi:enolase